MRRDGAGLATAGVICLIAHAWGWLGIGVLLLTLGAALAVRAWLRGPYEQPQKTSDVERAGREIGAQLVALMVANRVAPSAKEKGH